MAFSLVVDLSSVGRAGHKVKLSVEKSAPLSILRDRAFEQGKLPGSPGDYALARGRAHVDLATPVRMLGVDNNSRFDMVRASVSTAKVNIALQLDAEIIVPPRRIVHAFAPTTTLDEVLRHAEGDVNAPLRSRSGDQPKVAQVLYMNRPVTGSLRKTALRDLGLSGSVVLKVRLVDGVPEDEDVLEEGDVVVAPQVASDAPETDPMEATGPAVSSGPETPAAGEHSNPSREPQIIPWDVPRPAPVDASSSAEPTGPKIDWTKTKREDDEKSDSAPAPIIDWDSAKVSSRTGPEPEAQSTPIISWDSTPRIDAESQPRTAPNAATAQGPPPRQLVVFRPGADSSSTAAVIAAAEALPDDFFDLTADELRVEQAVRSRRVREETQGNATLKTRKMREDEERERMKKYPRVRIRILFPDRTIVEGIFAPDETLSAVAAFVTEQLLQPSPNFFFFTTPPMRRLQAPELLRRTLWSLGLVPAALLRVAFPELPTPPTSTDILTPSALASLQDLPPPGTSTPSTAKTPATRPGTSKTVPKWFKKR